MSTETDDGLLVCYSCERILGYVLRKESGPESVYLEKRVERRGNVYLCRHCRAIQWGYRAQNKEVTEC